MIFSLGGQGDIPSKQGRRESKILGSQITMGKRLRFFYKNDLSIISIKICLNQKKRKAVSLRPLSFVALPLLAN